MPFSTYTKGGFIALFTELFQHVGQDLTRARPDPSVNYGDIIEVIQSLPGSLNTLSKIPSFILRSINPANAIALLDKLPMKSVDTDKILQDISTIQTNFKEGRINSSEIEVLLTLAKFLNSHINNPVFRTNFFQDVSKFIAPLWRFIEYFGKDIRINGQPLNPNILVEQQHLLLEDLDVMHYALMTFLQTNEVIQERTTAAQKQNLAQLVADYQRQTQVKTFDLNIALDHAAHRSGISTDVLMAAADQIQAESAGGAAAAGHAAVDVSTIIDPSNITYQATPDYNWLALARVRPDTGLIDEVAEINEFKILLRDNPARFNEVDFTELLSARTQQSPLYLQTVAKLSEIQAHNKVTVREALAQQNAMTEFYSSRMTRETIKSLTKLRDDIATARQNVGKEFPQVVIAKINAVLTPLNNPTLRLDYSAFHAAYHDLQTFIKENPETKFHVEGAIRNEKVDLSELTEKSRILNSGLKDLNKLYSLDILATLGACEARLAGLRSDLPALIAAFEADRNELILAQALEQTAGEEDLTIGGSPASEEQNDAIVTNSFDTGRYALMYLNYLLTAVTVFAAGLAIMMQLWVVAAALAASSAVTTCVAYSYRNMKRDTVQLEGQIRTPSDEPERRAPTAAAAA